MQTTITEMMPTGLAYLTLMDYYTLSCAGLLVLMAIQNGIVGLNFGRDASDVGFEEWELEHTKEFDQYSLWAMAALWIVVHLYFVVRVWLLSRNRLTKKPRTLVWPGQKVVLAGTNRRWAGMRFNATVLGVNGEEDAINVKYMDGGGCKRFSHAEFKRALVRDGKVWLGQKAKHWLSRRLRIGGKQCNVTVVEVGTDTVKVQYEDPDDGDYKQFTHTEFKEALVMDTGAHDGDDVHKLVDSLRGFEKKWKVHQHNKTQTDFFRESIPLEPVDFTTAADKAGVWPRPPSRPPPATHPPDLVTWPYHPGHRSIGDFHGEALRRAAEGRHQDAWRLQLQPPVPPDQDPAAHRGLQRCAAGGAAPSRRARRRTWSAPVPRVAPDGGVYQQRLH